MRIFDFLREIETPPYIILLIKIVLVIVVIWFIAQIGKILYIYWIQGFPSNFAVIIFIILAAIAGFLYWRRINNPFRDAYL